MKKAIVFALIAVLGIAAFALAQDIRSVSSYQEPKAIRVAPYKPPPSYYYVPDEMVLKLAASAEETSRITVRQDSGVMVTGNSELDALNKKFGVTRFAREFPDMENVNELSEASGGEDMTKYYCLKFSEKYALQDVMRAYSQLGEVEATQPIGVHPVYESIPDDPRFLTDQWNFYSTTDHDVDATDAWDLETGDATVILGDLDTGTQYTSRDLGGLSPYTNGNMWINEPEYNGTPGVDDDGNGYVDDWIGWDFVDNVSGAWPGEDADTPDNEPTDFNGHGTHVGGIMGAITNNGYAVAGLAGGWNTGPSDPANGVKIMALRIGWSAPYPPNPSIEVGYVRMDFAAQAMYYATNKGVTAVNCSWGSSNSGGLGAAVTNAINNGVIVVHAAGNDNNQVQDYLASRTDVINVCATDQSDHKASFSSYGTWVDIAAPGVDIMSTYSYHYNPNYVAWLSGTSQATPHVAGAAGLIKSYVGTLTASEITDLILNHTDYIDDINPSYAGRLGSGRLNVYRSLDAAIAPSVTVIQPNGGEVLYIGQEYEIMWDASDNVGIDSSLVDYSHDGGTNWTRIGTLAGNPGSFIWTVTGPPSSTCRVRVTCYDGEGVAGDDMSDEDFCPPYKRAARDIMIVDAGAVPTEFALYQNYPNPFNANTQIRYALNTDGDVQLSVYNILGQKVATLVDGFQEAGHHTVNWDTGDAPSGMYLYRLQTEEYMATKKMVLLK
jgi:subtilisin family serine protease